MIRRIARSFAGGALWVALAICATAAAQESTSNATGPRTLSEDPEVESLLTRAEELAGRREYELAATLWQKLLDEAGHQLVTNDGELYAPLRELIFRKLAKLPANARRTYRITADGDARALLAAAGDDELRREVALAELTRRYFLSSEGDDAALELARLSLDRLDFVAASRLARMISREYPDPSVSLAQVWRVQAVADAYLGDRRAAESALERLGSQAPAEVAEVATLRAYFEREVYPRRGATRSAQSTGGVRALGWMAQPQPRLASPFAAGSLTEVLDQRWAIPQSEVLASSIEYPNISPETIHFASKFYARRGMAYPMVSYVSPSGMGGFASSSISYDFSSDIPVMSSPTTVWWGGPTLSSAPRGGANTLTDSERRSALAARWRQRLAQPSAQALVAHGLLIVRGIDEVSAWEAQEGTLKRRWESPWREGFASSTSTTPTAGSTPAVGPTPAAPTNPPSLFGDGLSFLMSTSGDAVYVVERSRLPRDGSAPAASRSPEAGRPKAGAPAEPAAPPEGSEKPDASEQSEPSKRTEPTGTPDAGEKPMPASPAPVATEPTVAPDFVVELDPFAGAGPAANATPMTRQRRNYLTAYEARTGRLLWRRSADDAAPIVRDPREPDGAGEEAGWLGAPVVWNDRLLAPVLAGGTYQLVALSADDGTTRWRVPLGEEPSSGSHPSAACHVTVAGGDAYVAPGNGMVYAVDARSGAVHWGARYARSGAPASMPNFQPGAPQPLSPSAWSGWESDATLVAGNLVLAFATDHDALLALDRRTGALRWSSPRRLPGGTAAHYALGSLGRRLFVAGYDVVRAYDLPSGRLEWERATPPMTGRGALTETALYLPVLGAVDSAVLALDPATGRELGTHGVTLTDPEPLGNLLSDGERLWSAGANRLIALAHLPQQLEALRASGERGDVQASWKRARLLLRLRRYEEGWEELRKAYQREAVARPAIAAERVLEIVLEERLAHLQPVAWLELVAEWGGLPAIGGHAELSQARERLTRAALLQLQRQRPPETVRVTLAIVRALEAAPESLDGDTQRILSAASRTLELAATASELPVLREAVRDDAPAATRIAVLRALIRWGDAADRDLVRGLLRAPERELRWGAAEALLELAGDARVLPTLVELAQDNDELARRRAVSLLRKVAGKEGARWTWELEPAARDAAIAEWKRWVERQPETLRLPLPGAGGAGWIDRVLVASSATGEVLEFDAALRPTWRSPRLPEPIAVAGTPEGHRLALTRRGTQVVEFDAQGHEIWRSAILPWPATGLERLADGTTRVVCPARDLVIDLAPDGQLLGTMVVRGGPQSTQTLPNGRTLVALSAGGRAVEVTASGEVEWELPEWPQIGAAQRLADGTTWIRQGTAGTLSLVGPNPPMLAWQRAGIKELVHGLRTLSGETIIVTARALERIGTDGKSLQSVDLGPSLAEGAAGY